MSQRNLDKPLDPLVNITNWESAIYSRQLELHNLLLKELKKMSAELDSLKQTAAKLSADVTAVLAAYQTAKANAVDPAELTGINNTLTAAVTAIDGALNPPAAAT